MNDAFLAEDITTDAVIIGDGNGRYQVRCCGEGCEFETGWWESTLDAGDDWVDHVRREHADEPTTVKVVELGDGWRAHEVFIDGVPWQTTYWCQCGRGSFLVEMMTVDGTATCPSCQREFQS